MGTALVAHLTDQTVALLTHAPIAGDSHAQSSFENSGQPSASSWFPKHKLRAFPAVSFQP